MEQRIVPSQAAIDHQNSAMTDSLPASVLHVLVRAASFLEGISGYGHQELKDMILQVSQDFGRLHLFSSLALRHSDHRFLERITSTCAETAKLCG
jgi:hypothetical protein